MCPCDTWTMENVTYDKMNSRVRGNLLSLEGNQKNLVGEGEKKGEGKRNGEKKKEMREI